MYRVACLLVGALLLSGCGSVVPVQPCNPGDSLSVNRPGICCPDELPFAADDGFCYTDVWHARSALACQPGWMPAVNNPGICCPADEPYIYSDGHCYPDLDTARIAGATTLADARRECQPTAYFIVDFEAWVYMVRIFRDDGLSPSRVLNIVKIACEDVCGNAWPCAPQCMACGAAVIAAVYAE